MDAARFARAGGWSCFAPMIVRRKVRKAIWTGTIGALRFVPHWQP
jgi:hypothetical protein